MTQHCSIALATCNGARYLPAMLDSLMKQQRLPFELIACDDASSDITINILDNFATRAPFRVTVIRNPTRLGVVGNFSQAIAACHGDIIALADQDDYWHPEKLTQLVETLESPATLAAFSNAQVVGPEMTPLGFTMWERVHFTPHEQTKLTQPDGFRILLKHHIVTGATMAFKSELRELALPIPATWAHDAWLALIAAAYGRLQPIPAPLIDYRQHDENVVGGRKRSLLQDSGTALRMDRSVWYEKEIARWQCLKDHLTTAKNMTLALDMLDEKITHLKTRAYLPKSRWQRLPHIWRELTTGRYTAYARNWGSVALDVLLK